MFRKKWEVYQEETGTVVARFWRYSKAKKEADEKNWALFVKDDAWTTGISHVDYTVYKVRRVD